MKNMQGQAGLALSLALLAALPAQAQKRIVHVQQPPPLPAVFGGGVHLYCPPPVYPVEALRYTLEGETIVELVIDVDGQIKGQRVSTSSGWRILDEATLSHAAACRYAPITLNGQAVKKAKRFSFVWTLRDDDGKPVIPPPILRRDTCVGAGQLVQVDGPLGGTGVLLRLMTSLEGAPLGVKVEQGSGDEAVDGAAVRMLQTCQFTPSIRDGKAEFGSAFARYRPDLPVDR